MKSWFSVLVVIAVGSALLRAGEVDKNGIEIVGRSADGTFRIEKRWRGGGDGERSDSYDAYVVPERGTSDAALLEGEVDSTMDRTYQISPDGHWIYAEWKCYTRRSSCELFERKDGLDFVAAFPDDPATESGGGRFDEASWQFFRKVTKLEYPEYPRLVDFVAWAPDSSRVLVTLRGAASSNPEKQAEEDERKWPGIFDWKVYWNTQKRDFELTPLLKANNAGATKRWGGNARYDRLFEPYFAEPIAALPSVQTLKLQRETAQAAFEQQWMQAEQSEKQETENRPEDSEAKKWPELAKSAATWRKTRLAEVEVIAERSAKSFPAKQREQWRLLSLIGALRVATEDVERHDPWR